MPLLELTTKSLPATLAANKSVLVDFWAPWCGPCKSMMPSLEKLSGEFVGKTLFTKVNIDDESDLAGQFGIRSVPTVLLLRNGVVSETWVGTASESVWRKRLTELAA